MACAKDPNENLAKAEWRIREAAGNGAQDHFGAGVVPLAVFLPRGKRRLVRSGRASPAPPKRALRVWRDELGVVIIGSIFERRTAGVYHNTALVIDADGALLGAYRKMHIPDDPLYFEKYYFTPGDLGFRCFDTRFARIAPLVCWDQWYPEAARLAALAGAQVLILSHGHRLASCGKGRIRRGAARRLANHSARARHRQRPVCGGGESRGLRRAAGTRSGILGRLVRRRSVRRGAGGSERTLTKKLCWWNATRAASRRRAATGRSCATGASMPTRPF